MDHQSDTPFLSRSNVLSFSEDELAPSDDHGGPPDLVAAEEGSDVEDLHHGAKRCRSTSFDVNNNELSDSVRLQRSRERNREHARRTRLRKKAQLQALKVRVAGLQSEQHQLKQGLEDCVTAKLLLDLSSFHAATCDPRPPSSDLHAPAQHEHSCHHPPHPHPHATAATDRRTTGLAGQTVALVKDPVTQQLRMQQKVHQRGGDAGVIDDSFDPSIDFDAEETQAAADGLMVPMRGTINWKAGFTLESDGTQRKLSPDELERLRRERNRLHAKMTRNRKKVFVANVEQTIVELEETNALLRAQLQSEYGPMSRRCPALIPNSMATGLCMHDTAERAHKRARSHDHTTGGPPTLRRVC